MPASSDGENAEQARSQFTQTLVVYQLSGLKGTSTVIQTSSVPPKCINCGWVVDKGELLNAKGERKGGRAG